MAGSYSRQAIFPSIVLTTTREHAELKRDQIHAFGKDPLIATCQGSMSASIEPMPE